MKGRTVVIVSHHVSLVLPVADMIVSRLLCFVVELATQRLLISFLQIALEHGDVVFKGSAKDFANSPSFKGILQEEAEAVQATAEPTEAIVEDVLPSAKASVASSEKLIKTETREEGGISSATYRLFLSACVSRLVC